MEQQKTTPEHTTQAIAQPPSPASVQQIALEIRLIAARTRQARMMIKLANTKGEGVSPEKRRQLLNAAADLLIKGRPSVPVQKKRSKKTSGSSSKRSIRYQSNPKLFLDFIHDCCVVNPAAKMLGNTLFKAYQAWAEDHQTIPVTQREFNAELVEQGFEKRRSSGNQLYFFGIMLNPLK